MYVAPHLLHSHCWSMLFSLYQHHTALFPWSYQMAAAMDSAIVYSSPVEPLPRGTSIALQGAVWHHMRANNTGLFVSINPSFHARNGATGYVKYLLQCRIKKHGCRHTVRQRPCWEPSCPSCRGPA